MFSDGFICSHLQFMSAPVAESCWLSCMSAFQCKNDSLHSYSNYYLFSNAKVDQLKATKGVGTNCTGIRNITIMFT